MALLDNLAAAVTALEAAVTTVVAEVNTLKANSADPAAAQALADRVTAAATTLTNASH